MVYNHSTDIDKEETENECLLASNTHFLGFKKISHQLCKYVGLQISLFIIITQKLLCLYNHGVSRATWVERMVSLAMVLYLYATYTSLCPVPVPAVKLPPMLSPPWPRPPCKEGDRSSCLGKPQQPLEHLLESKMLMVREHKYFIKFLPCFHLNLHDMTDNRPFRKRLSFEFFFIVRQLIPRKILGASDPFTSWRLRVSWGEKSHGNGYLTELLI